MTRFPLPHPPRRAAMLTAAVLVTGTAAAGSLLGAAPAMGAETREVTLAQSTVDAIHPVCRTGWTLKDDDKRLRPSRSRIVDAVSRDVAVAVCLQLYPADTRLTSPRRSPVPPLTPAPVRIVVEPAPVAPATTTSTTPRAGTSAAPPHASGTGTGTGTGATSTGSAGSTPAPASVATAPAPAAPAAPAGTAPAALAGDPGTTSIPFPGAPLGSGLPAGGTGTGVDPLTAGAPLGAGLPGAQPDAAAPGLDPLAAGAPADATGASGAADPSTSTVAEAGPLDRDGGLSAALVAGVLGAVALLGLLAREIAVHGLPRRLAALPFLGATAAGADLTAGGVRSWPSATGPAPDDDRTGPIDLSDLTGPIDLGDLTGPIDLGAGQPLRYSATNRSSTTLATWPPGDPNG